MKHKHTTTTERTHTTGGGNDVVLSLPATVGGVTVGMIVLLTLTVFVLVIVVMWKRKRKLIILAFHNGMTSTNEYPLAGSNPIYKGELFTQTVVHVS